MNTIGKITVPTTPVAGATTARAVAADARREDVRPAAPAVPPATPAAKAEPPPISAGKLQLDIDRATGQVVGRIIDKETGATIKQIPSDEALRLIATNERILGALLDKLL
jgi:hypothetical protein